MPTHPIIRRLPAVALSLALAFILLTAAVLAGLFDPIDQRLLAPFARFAQDAPDWLHSVSTWFQFSGSAGLLIVTPLLLLFWLVCGHRRRFALLFATVALCQPLWMALQFGIGRERPTPVSVWPGVQLYSYPSGHTMLNSAFYIGIAYIIITALQLSRRKRRILSVAIAVLLLLIGLNRLFFGVHYLSDIIAGYLAGSAWAAIAIWLVERNGQQFG